MREHLKISGDEIYGNLFPGAADDHDNSNRVKFFTWISLLQRIVGYTWCSAIALGSMAASDCFAVDQSFEYLNVEVESISYQGNNTYTVDVSVYNRTANTITVKEHRASFYVQTEILGQWKELSTSSSGAAGALLSPRKGLRMAYILNIPLTIPSLYRNSEGDINMMFKYVLRFVPGPGTGLRSNSGESSYWITPKTNTWVLREGM